MIPKFRAWDKECMEMANVTDISYKGNWVVDEPYVALDTRCDLLPFDDIELMQSTGLKDKNDVEIFEGDIIKNSNGSTGYVTYLQQEAGFVVVLKKSDYRLGHRNTGESYAEATNHEVIGNIYENGELLKQ
ncbi:YopX family protein [Enterococcus mundtii]|uniref:YopX family protein n=1 Tax=Enterococcus TaxID=1350 RepID=UPI000C269902|nr:YopX family protein [Enterococcus mundtii]MDY4307200.1 YopX family protein [Enterococcus mundtii]PJK27088.1 hypothetical protein CV769_01555 [Enterococcus mundtii]